MKTHLSDKQNHRLTGFRALPFLLLMLSAIPGRAGYDYTPVILHLPAEKQPDSLGFNLVEALPKLVYRGILDGRIKLYHNAAKELQISPANLIRLEQENQLQFVQVQDLFLSEVWKLYHRSFESQIIGFSFFARKSDQKLLNFGFVDAAEVKFLLETAVAETNLNGPDSLNYWQALHSKAFYFQIVKFGNKDLLQKPEQAFRLKQQAACARKHTTLYLLERRKFVRSIVYPSKDKQVSNLKICRALESHYRKNPDLVFAHIERPAAYTGKDYPIALTHLEIYETWFWKEGKALRRTNSIRVYINEVPMTSITWGELQNLKLMVEFRPLTELIEEGNFTFNIVQVNSVLITNQNQPIVQNALILGNWTRIKLKNG